jgi:hypothetical protein
LPALAPARSRARSATCVAARAPTSIEFDLAAFEQRAAQPSASALHARLEARSRQPQFTRELALRCTTHVDTLEQRAILGREPRQERRETTRDLGRRARALCVGGDLVAEFVARASSRAVKVR